MYPNNDRVSIPQMVNILVLTIIGIGILTLPRELAEVVGTDGWLVLIVGGVISMVIAFLHGLIIQLFPGKDFFEILEYTLTKPLAYIICIFLCTYFLVNIGLIVRIYGTVIKILLLPRTPEPLVGIMMLLTVVYLVRVGIEPMARLSNILFPITVVFVVILFALSFYEADFQNLLPVFQSSPLKIIEASNIVIYSFLGFELLLIFGTHLKEPQKATRIGPIVVGIVLVFYLLLNTSIIGNFGVDQTKSLIWPTFNVFRTIELPGAFIENVELLVMAIWIFSIFMTVAPFYLGTTILLGDIMAVKEHNYFALPILPLIHIIGVYGEGLAEVYEDLTVFTDYAAYPVILAIPLLIFIGLGIKKFMKGKATK